MTREDEEIFKSKTKPLLDAFKAAGGNLNAFSAWVVWYAARAGNLEVMATDYDVQPDIVIDGSK